MKVNRKKIIICDNDVEVLNLGKKALINSYDVFTIPSDEKLFALLEKVTPDLILLAVNIPFTNGYEVIKVLKSSKDTEHIPVIFLADLGDMEGEPDGFELGAIDYITKPFSPPLLLKRIEIHMLVESQKNQLNQYKEKTKTVFNLQNAILKTVVDLVEWRDDNTEGHIERTQNYLKIFLDALIDEDAYSEEISSWDIDAFILAAGLHDVGKIAVKDSILLKPDGLTTDEFNEIKAHTKLGARIIRRIEKSTGQSSFLSYAEVLAGSHHEKWNGEGYPFGLSAADIPLQARILAIVDVYDALTNDRPYKKAASHEEAVEIIKSESGAHFEPLLVDIFMKYARLFRDAELPDFQRINDGMAFSDEFSGTVSKVISEIVDYRSGMNTGGIERIQRSMRILTNALLNHERYKETVSAWDIELFILSAKLYDIGKMSINDTILNKPEKLTKEEFAQIKAHTDFGVRAIQRMGENTDGSVFLEYAENLTGRHHENWDGTGYPLGLSGESIPLQSRLMAIIDVYNALISPKHYKNTFSHKEAVEIIKNGSGTQFDPGLVEVFLEHEREIENYNETKGVADEK